MPKPGLVEASVRTFHHHLLQNDYITVSHENPLGLGPQTEAVPARYLRQRQRHILMLVDYPSASDARLAQRNFTARVLGGATPARLAGRWAGLKRSGNRLIIALDVRSRPAARRVLSEVP